MSLKQYHHGTSRKKIYYVFKEVSLCNMLEQYQPSFFVLSLVTLTYLECHCLKYLEYYLNTIVHEHINYLVLLLGVGGTKSCVIPLPLYTSKCLCEPSDTHCNLQPITTAYLQISLSIRTHPTCLCPQLCMPLM